MKKDIIIGTLLLILGFVLGLMCKKDHIREVTKMVTDTLVVVDTHIIEKPVLVERTSEDTLLIAVHDTTIINDTIFVPIPIEKKIYKGEDYLAEISGYRANLDRIEVYPKTTIVTQTKSVIRHNKLALGAELQYNGNTYIPIYLEYSHLLHKNVEMSAKILYDLPSQMIGVGMGIQLQIGW
jgi:hypothetical protein